MERFTITRTRRYGNSDTQISNVFTGMRNNTKKDAKPQIIPRVKPANKKAVINSKLLIGATM